MRPAYKNIKKAEKPFNIYLSDLANNFFEIDNKSIPIGVGYVGAYCKEIFGSAVNVRLFRTADSLLREVIKNPPRIVGFGSYDWNYNLTLKVGKKIKQTFPECITVMGGANVDIDPDENKYFLENNPYIDLLIFGDGELSFADIVKFYLDLDKTKDARKKILSIPIDGVRSLYKGKLIMGKVLNITEDLNKIPSPYLTGMFDELLKNNKLMPIIQKVRGCPNHCSFCVSGRQSSKLRSFSVERVIAEIDYLKKHAKNRIIRFSDDNFGIFKGDLQVAEYLNETHKRYHYPIGLKLYSSKHLNKITQKLALVLKDLSLMNISFQSLDPTILKSIKRSHLSFNEILGHLDFARKNNIPTGTELILGLPGETLESVKNTIDKTVGLRFDSVGLGILWLLRGTELTTGEARKEHAFKSKFMLAENAISMIDGEISFEADEVAVASNTYSPEDYKVFLKYLFICDFSIGSGYAKELLFHGLSFGINPSRVFDELFSRPDLYPAVNKATEAFLKCFTEHMFDTRKELGNFVKRNIDYWVNHEKNITSISKSRMIQEFVADMLFGSSEQRVFIEFEKAINALFNDKSDESFYNLTKHIRELTEKLIINPKNEVIKDVAFHSDFHLLNWVRDGYAKSLSEYKLTKGKDFILSIRNHEFIKHLIEKDRIELKNSFNFFRYTISTDRKRFINKYLLK